MVYRGRSALRPGRLSVRCRTYRLAFMTQETFEFLVAAFGLVVAIVGFYLAFQRRFG